MNEQIKDWMNEWLNEWMNEWMNEWQLKIYCLNVYTILKYQSTRVIMNMHMYVDHSQNMSQFKRLLFWKGNS